MSEMLSRRKFLRRAGVLGAGAAAALTGCQAKVVEVTKIVEKEVEKVVEQTVVVKEAVEVEKEVTRVVEKAVPAEATEQKFTIVHWAEGTSLLPETQTGAGVERATRYRDKALELWADIHPNVEVKFEDHGWDEALRQNLVTALLGGTGPDTIVGENFFQQYADLGAMLAVDDAIADIKDDLIPGCYAAAVTGGKAYGINQFTACFSFERNPNVIEAAGLDPETPPKYWSELLDQAQKITEAGNGEYYGYTLQGPVGFSVGGIFRIAVYMKQASADICKEDCTYPWFDNPKGEKVLSFIREINRFTPPGLTFNADEGQVYSQLFNGLSAYQMCGTWHIQWARDSGLDNAMYSGIPIPDEDGKPASIVVANVINGALTASKHPTEAIDLCKLFTAAPLQDMIFEVNARMPGTYSGIERLKPSLEPAAAAFANEIATADLGVLPQWRTDPQKLWTIYNDMLTAVLSTEDPLADLMGEAQQQADAVMQG